MTYIKQTGEPNGDAGDQYTGLDRFGRVVDQRWIVTANGTHTDRFKYGMDRDSDRLFRDNSVNTSFGELYHANGPSNGYDQLNQLTDFRRGTLSDTNADGVPDTVGTSSRTQGWAFDALGNWSTLTTDGNPQNRTHNQQNQITSITGQTTPVYDSNGNMIVDQNGKTLIFDPWNRFFQYKNGATTLISYAYDPLNRRITENPGTLKDLFYSSQWQVLEERTGSTVQIQYVWSPVYVDALIERDRDADANPANGLEERFYVQQDANWNVTEIFSTAGTVFERYIYDPYGQVTFLNASWSTLGSSAYSWIYLHQSGRLDTTSALYIFRHRDYSPALGRWIENDAEGFRAGDDNFYRYVSNGPTISKDPTGFCQGVCKINKIIFATKQDQAKPYDTMVKFPHEKRDWIDTNKIGPQTESFDKGAGAVYVFWVIFEGENLSDCKIGRVAVSTRKFGNNPPEDNPEGMGYKEKQKIENGFKDDPPSGFIQPKDPTNFIATLDNPGLLKKDAKDLPATRSDNYYLYVYSKKQTPSRQVFGMTILLYY